MGYKVWLDDCRPEPQGWIRCYWPDEVIKHLETGNVEIVSLDHDLGDDDRGTGYDVLTWVEEQVALIGEVNTSPQGKGKTFAPNNFAPPKFHVHSDNGPGRDRMNLAIMSIERLYKKSGKLKLPLRAKVKPLRQAEEDEACYYTAVVDSITSD